MPFVYHFTAAGGKNPVSQLSFLILDILMSLHDFDRPIILMKQCRSGVRFTCADISSLIGIRQSKCSFARTSSHHSSLCRWKSWTRKTFSYQQERQNVSPQVSFFFVCLKENSHMGKLDNIFFTGLNVYGPGRIEESLRMLETSSQEWEVVRNYLPVFSILARIYFWENSALENRRFDQKSQKLLFPGIGTVAGTQW